MVSILLPSTCIIVNVCVCVSACLSVRPSVRPSITVQKLNQWLVFVHCLLKLTQELSPLTCLETVI